VIDIGTIKPSSMRRLQHRKLLPVWGRAFAARMAFSSEVDTGWREEEASEQRPEAGF
jgi:hypothetical protein